MSERRREHLAFVRELIAFRKAHPLFRRRTFLTGWGGDLGCKDVSWWHPWGREMRQEDWQDPALTGLGMLLCGGAYGERDRYGREASAASVLVLFHARGVAGAFTLPGLPLGYGAAWQQCWGTDPEASGAGEALRPGQVVELVADGVTVFEAVD